MSLGELSEQSGVAKSIISQIERNETNPTIGTVFRLSKALETTIDEVLRVDSGVNFIEHQTRSGIPNLESQDGLCRLAIAGPLNLVESLQWYDFQAKPGGVLESDPHPPGTIEHLYLLKGELEVTPARKAACSRRARLSASMATGRTSSSIPAASMPTRRWCWSSAIPRAKSGAPES